MVETLVKKEQETQEEDDQENGSKGEDKQGLKESKGQG